MAKAKTLDLTIQEKLGLLDEAITFFANMSEVWIENMQLGLHKAAALSTVKECLEVYQAKILDWAEWTEETLKDGMETVIDEEYIDNMIEMKKMDEECASFYRGWFGLAIWLLQWDKESIDWLRELEAEYDNVVEFKLHDKTIWDLLK